MFSGKRRKQALPFRYTLQSLGAVAVLALAIRVFLVASYAMSGVSMLPNILPGDFLVASKWDAQTLQRGQIIAMDCPLNVHRICLKRVIGLEGDRIEFRQGKLILNNVPAQYRNIGTAFRDEVVEGQSWLTWPDNSLFTSAPLVVAPGQVYVVNDKRSELDDSRSWGPVPTALVTGRARLVWLSLEWYDGDQVRSWPRVRWNRILRSIH